MQSKAFFFIFLFLGASSADYLENPDFETPPTDLLGDVPAPFLQLSQHNNIPGWSFQGTVLYVTASEDIALPDNGHGIQLGPDGKINQTFSSGYEDMEYVLTFTLTSGGRHCSNHGGVIVSALGSQGVFKLKHRYGKHPWQIYGHYLGFLREEEPINLVIESQNPDFDSDSTCWPVIDSITVKTISIWSRQKKNMLFNGGFELGPEFLSRSTEGILINAASDPIESPLRHWAVIGTIRYIDSENFIVPDGNAAVELISGASSSGIERTIMLKNGSIYTLEFILGDANNGCEGDFIVGVRAGSEEQILTIQSNGTGSANKFSMKFEAGLDQTVISFLSYSSAVTKDGVFCGPVVDKVVLRPPKTLMEKYKFTITNMAFMIALRFFF